jgi:dTDP-4-dehydrorhamnose 3,5-epimerase-like enzyme
MRSIKKTGDDGSEILEVIDERGFFNNIPVEKYKRVYIIKNHQLNTCRAYHEHPVENILLFCVKGVWKVIHYNLKTQLPIVDVLKEGDFIEVPAPAANGLMNLTEDAIMLVCASLSLEEVRTEEVKVPWNTFGEEIWLTKRK